MTFTLTREGERPAETMHTLAPAATPEQESAAAHRLIDAYATKALEKGDTNDKVRVLEVLARVDPARTLELTEGNTLTEPFLKAMFRMRVATALLESAPDEALAVAESIDDPAARAMALLKAVDALPATEKAKKQELLDRALIGAKAARADRHPHAPHRARSPSTGSTWASPRRARPCSARSSPTPSSCPTPRGPPTPRGRSPRSSARSTSTRP